FIAAHHRAVVGKSLVSVYHTGKVDFSVRIVNHESFSALRDSYQIGWWRHQGFMTGSAGCIDIIMVFVCIFHGGCEITDVFAADLIGANAGIFSASDVNSHVLSFPRCWRPLRSASKFSRSSLRRSAYRISWATTCVTRTIPIINAAIIETCRVAVIPPITAIIKPVPRIIMPVMSTRWYSREPVLKGLSLIQDMFSIIHQPSYSPLTFTIWRKVWRIVTSSLESCITWSMGLYACGISSMNFAVSRYSMPAIASRRSC